MASPETGVQDTVILETYNRVGSMRGTARALGLSWGSTLRSRIRRLVAHRQREERDRRSYESRVPQIPQMTERERKPEELIKHAVEHRKRLQAHLDAKHGSVIALTDTKPFGVAILPDQHMDNPGSDLDLIVKHAELIKQTDGLYAVAVGDAIDNFIIGKLESARREHLVTVREAWKLLEYYFAILGVKLLAAISGNHLDWTTRMGGVDHLESVLRQCGLRCLYDADELFFSLKSSNGSQWKWGLRHFFQGHSMWNSAHSIVRYVMSSAYRHEDVVVAGHKHIAGFGLIESRGQQNVLCIQVGSYKDRDYDDYCRQRGFMQQHPFRVPVVIHFPRTRGKLFIPEIEQAIPYLAFLRRSKA